MSFSRHQDHPSFSGARENGRDSHHPARSSMYVPISKDPNTNILHALEDQSLRFIPLLRYQQVLESLCTAYEAPMGPKVDYGTYRWNPLLHPSVPYFRSPYTPSNSHIEFTEPLDSTLFMRRREFCECNGKSHREVCECRQWPGEGLFPGNPEQSMVPLSPEPTYYMQEGYQTFHRSLDIGILKRGGQLITNNDQHAAPQAFNHFHPAYTLSSHGPQFVWLNGSLESDNSCQQQYSSSQEPHWKKRKQAMEEKAEEFALSEECSKLVQVIESRRHQRMPYTRSFPLCPES